MMMSHDLAILTAAAGRTLLDRGEVSALELIEAVLRRSEKINPNINAIIDIDAGGAREAARDADARRKRGETLGALDGVPVTVKDNLGVRGRKATWGSRIFAERVASTDDPAVARLRRGGAVIWAKTNLPEMALAGITENALFGTTRNPLDLALTPGGSSGGAAAALAAGLGPLAVGTDAGGSARRPAAYTGTVGFRPSNGMIARGTLFPSTTYDCQVIAPMARTVTDAAILFETMRGPDIADRTALISLAARQEGLPSRYRVRYFPTVERKPIDSVIARTVATAVKRLEDMGHIVNESSAPYSLDEMETLWSVLIAAGAAAARRTMPEPMPPLTRAIEALIARGAKLTAEDYVRTVATIHDIRRRFDRLFEDCDILLSPASPCFPWSIGEPYPKQIANLPAGPRDAAIFYPFVNIAGLPAITIPVGGVETSLPVGLQLVAGFGRDAALLVLAQSIEAAYPWRQPSSDSR